MTERPAQGSPASELTPDQLEQRQRLDGTLVDGAGTPDEVPEGPIDADVIEQHQVVEIDDEDDHPRD
ncbi:hypothetical protein [Nitriliruptor alkaliphilus]|uniref:hypothetical protein n=1 Tax=Nitriliruptor alkaliphilus TaxID=427918 RepID=UPI000698C11C|nr:hypothetical protein [Nitriliruptor alkaliphilus]